MNRLVLAMIAVVALPGFATQNSPTTNAEASTAAVATNRSKEACPWPENLDAVKAAPENHKVIFENEHVRVLEVTIAPHSKEPIHAHCWPSTLYIQQAGDAIDRDANGKILFDSRQLKVKPKVPFVEWTPAEAPHSVENLDDLPLKLIRIENKVATNRSQETCPWPTNLDAVKAAPETHKVIFENEHVRVLEVTIAAHSKEPIHTHCWPSTLYIQQIGDIIDGDANGKILFDSRQLKVKQNAPFVLWTPPEGPHSVETLDDLPMKLIQIENKD
jgi:quercetin dioxygenase-like cupin family protein